MKEPKVLQVLKEVQELKELPKVLKEGLLPLILLELKVPKGHHKVM